MKEAVKDFFGIEGVRRIQPIVHCITNYVAANDVANMVLAAGASPIMADGLREAEDIAAVSHGLALNLGTLRETAVDAMILAGKKSAQLGHPVLLDPVGAAAAAFRREIALRILKEVPCSVVRGNASEIRAIAQELLGEPQTDGFHCRGVDSDRDSELTQDNQMETVKAMKLLSRRTGAVIVMTGEIDVVADENQVCLVKNGCSMMRRITGSGCMMDGIITAFLAAGFCEKDHIKPQTGDDVFQATVYAVAAVGICGELAYEKTMNAEGGTGTFHMYFIDAMSLLTDEMIRRRIRIEQAAEF